MPRPQFSIRTLLWLTLVVAVACEAGPPVVRPLRRWLWPPLECMVVPDRIEIIEEDESLLVIPPSAPEDSAPQL
jgi:hypothetical protein